MSPDVTDMSSRKQTFISKSVQLVGKVVTCVIYFMTALICVPFYLSEICHFVVIYILVVLVVFIWVSRLL